MQTGLFTSFLVYCSHRKKGKRIFLGVSGVNGLAIVSKTGQHYGRILKAYVSHGLWQLGLKQWGKHAPFYRLRQQLMQWNTQRLQQFGATAALSAQDISSIRQMMEQAQQCSTVPVPPALLDQWFFLAIGAIQVQSQTGADKAWHVFDQSVHSQLARRSFPLSLSLGICVTLCVVWMMNITPVHKPAQQMTLSPLQETQSAGGTADPVTLSLLNLVYQKMQNGSCQLPQAAMLPAAQRQAFMMFVTEGKVDVDHVEYLRQALGYVSCLYPQELMRPQGRELI